MAEHVEQSGIDPALMHFSSTAPVSEGAGRLMRSSRHLVADLLLHGDPVPIDRVVLEHLSRTVRASALSAFPNAAVPPDLRLRSGESRSSEVP